MKQFSFSNICSFLLTLFSFVLISSCTVFKKSINKPVTISFKDYSFMPELKANADYNKYVSAVSPEEISSEFFKGFKSEANNTSNVTLQENEEGADFILKLVRLDVRETDKVEKINDSDSPYNGQEVILNTVDVSATFELINTKKPEKKLMRCSNTKSRAEKLKNNRNIGDLIKGTNKDHNTYRTKLLSDDICKNLAEDVGRRIWVPITRRIAKNL